MDLWWLTEPIERRPSWMRRIPDRLGWELKELNRYGTVDAVDKAAWTKGVLALHYRWLREGRNYPLLIVYPAGFPWARPDVYLRTEKQAFPRRHCDPHNGRLCYLDHHRHAWGPGMSIGAVINEQLPKILTADDPTQEEEAVGEPAENWWNTFSKANSVFVIDSSWEVGTAAQGKLSLAYSFSNAREPDFRCLCTEVADDTGIPLAGWSRAVPVEFIEAPQLRVPWVRLENELFPIDAADGFRTVLARLGNVPIVKLNASNYAKIFAAVFPTEITHGTTGDSWVLFIISGSRRGLADNQEAKLTFATVRTLRAGIQDVARRAPASAILRGRRIVVVGAGAIGAPIVCELARNGVAAIAVVDSDRVTPGNGIRWPFGESAWGRLKVDVLADRIKREHSGTEIHRFPYMLGDIDIDAADGPGADLRHMLDEADAVIDASTMFDAVSILAERCREIGVPLISVNATPTLEGGAVACFMPKGGCPTCLVLHQQAALPTMPSPPGEFGNAFAVAIPGCAEATFAGSSYDLGELSLEAVRLLARTLTDRPAISLIETLSFEGYHRLPAWRIDQLPRHVQCGCGG